MPSCAPGARITRRNWRASAIPGAVRAASARTRSTSGATRCCIERQRAEIAIDQCRVTHQSIGPVSLPLRDDAVTHTGTPADIFRDPELAAMGLADGLAP